MPIATIGEVWRYRRLLGFIGDRALRKMYRRTVLGWLWLFINPLFPIALRAVIFGGLLGVGSDGIPYFLFLLAGTVVWDVFAASLMWGTRVARDAPATCPIRSTIRARSCRSAT